MKYVFEKIEITRRMGQTQCPEYSFSISSDGFIEFEGLTNTMTLGNHHWAINKKKIEFINNLVNRYKIYEIDENKL